MKKEKKILNKIELKGLIEPFIFDRLEKITYESEIKSARLLLTWNRLDLAFKLCYIEFNGSIIELATSVYYHDIHAQGLGTFTEVGNQAKNSFSAYKNVFDKLIIDVSKNGFNQDISLIPLATDGSICNGAHRTACAIARNKYVTTVQLGLQPMVCDYRFFYERKVPEQILEIVINKFIEYSPDNVYLAFLWPSGKSRREEAEALFPNVIYRKEITLTHKGAFNLLANLYEGMDWAGNIEEGFQGINQKLVECFPRLDPCTVIAFQAERLSDVRLIKEQVRSIYKIGFSSVHITDTKAEAMKIASLIFNNNGMHFLNHALPYKFSGIYERLEKFEAFLTQNKVDSSEVLIDGSTVLGLYGIRNSEDIDFLLIDKNRILNQSKEFEMHDQELVFHMKGKSELILDPKNYFIFKGFKLVSFEQLYLMKLNRNQSKDICDCALMEAYVSNNILNKITANLKQNLLYCKVRVNRMRIILFYGFLKKTGLYAPIKHVYHLIKAIIRK